MNSITEKGVLRVDVEVSISGPMQKGQAETLQKDLLKFFKDRKVNVRGDFKYIAVSTFGVEHNYSYQNTSTI